MTMLVNFECEFVFKYMSNIWMIVLQLFFGNSFSVSVVLDWSEKIIKLKKRMWFLGLHPLRSFFVQLGVVVLVCVVPGLGKKSSGIIETGRDWVFLDKFCYDGSGTCKSA